MNTQLSLRNMLIVALVTIGLLSVIAPIAAAISKAGSLSSSQVYVFLYGAICLLWLVSLIPLRRRYKGDVSASRKLWLITGILLLMGPCLFLYAWVQLALFK